MCAMQVARSKHGGKLKKDSHDFLNLYHAPPEMKYISRTYLNDCHDLLQDNCLLTHPIMRRPVLKKRHF